MKMTQSNVNDNFPMLVPIEPGTAEWQALAGKSSQATAGLDEKIPLKGLKDKPKRAAIHSYDNGLGSPKPNLGRSRTENEQGITCVLPCSCVLDG